MYIYVHEYACLSNMHPYRHTYMCECVKQKRCSTEVILKFKCPIDSTKG